jgi:AFG3 family protein
LLSKEVLGRDDLIRILGKRPFEDNKEFHKYFGADAGKSEPSPIPPPVGGDGLPAPVIFARDP